MIDLISAKGIDYLELEKLLKVKEWKKANDLTARHILQASECEKDGYINIDKVKTFPCDDLMTIDRLWTKYSDGLYGFSAQQKTYIECGGSLDFSFPDDNCWQEFLKKRPSFPNLDDFLVKQQASERQNNLKILGQSILCLLAFFVWRWLFGSTSSGARIPQSAGIFGSLVSFLSSAWSWLLWGMVLLIGVSGLLMSITYMLDGGAKKFPYSVLLLSQIDVCRVKID